jgi:hypothetical protein
MVRFQVVSQRTPTVSIEIVADCKSRNFLFYYNFYVDYNICVYYYFGYYFYTALCFYDLYLQNSILRLILLKYRFCSIMLESMEYNFILIELRNCKNYQIEK